MSRRRTTAAGIVLVLIAVGAVAYVIGRGSGDSRGHGKGFEPVAQVMGPTVDCHGIPTILPPLAGPSTSRNAPSVPAYPAPAENYAQTGKASCSVDVGGDVIAFDLDSTAFQDPALVNSDVSPLPVGAPLTGDEFTNPSEFDIAVPSCFSWQNGGTAWVQDPQTSPSLDLEPGKLRALVLWVDSVRDAAHCTGPRLPLPTASSASATTSKVGNNLCGITGVGLPPSDANKGKAPALYQLVDPVGTDVLHCRIGARSDMHFDGNKYPVQTELPWFSIVAQRGGLIEMPYAPSTRPISGFRGSADQASLPSSAGSQTVIRLSTDCQGVPLLLVARQQDTSPLPPPTQMFGIVGNAIAQQMGCEPITTP